VAHRSGWLLQAFPQALLVVLRHDVGGARAFHALAELVQRAERLGTFERALVCRAAPGRLGALAGQGGLAVRDGKRVVALAFLPRARWAAAFWRLESTNGRRD
jgi:hypothetical protein